MVNFKEYFKTKEFLISLIYIPILISISLISGQNEIAFAIVSGVFALALLVSLVILAIKNKAQDRALKIQSFVKFLISSILMLLVGLLIQFSLMQGCSGGLCGLSEAEVLILFIPIQILSVLVYGLSLLIIH